MPILLVTLPLAIVLVATATSFGISWRARRFYDMTIASAVLGSAYVSNALSVGTQLTGVLRLFLAIAFATLFSVLAEHLLYGPLAVRGGRADASTIASLGLLTTTQALISLHFGPALLVSNRADPSAALLLSFAALAVLTFTMALRQVLMRDSSGQLAMGDDPDLAALLGLPVHQLRQRAALLSGAYAGVAGYTLAETSGIHPLLGLRLLVLGSVAAFAGGLTHALGWAVAALLVASIYLALAYALAAEWADLVLLACLLLILYVRRRGLVTRRFRVDADE